jgi:hypothetical protein
MLHEIADNLAQVVIPNPCRLRVRDLLFARIEEKADSEPRSKSERRSE